MPLGVLHLPAGGRAVQCRRRHGAGRRRKRARAMPLLRARGGCERLRACAQWQEVWSESCMWARQAGARPLRRCADGPLAT
jgi:hypothetical protein